MGVLRRTDRRTEQPAAPDPRVLPTTTLEHEMVLNLCLAARTTSAAAASSYRERADDLLDEWVRRARCGSHW